MKRWKQLLSLTVIAAALVAAVALAGEPASGRYAVEVTLAPAAEPEGAYEAEALVTDLASGEALAAPRIVFLRGEWGQVQSGSLDGLMIEIKVGVDESGETATYEAEIREGETLLSSQRVSFRLTG